MNIAVCIKQVPERSEGSMDPETGVLIRAGLKSVINPYDLSAIETALRIRETAGGCVSVFTMGPQSAEAVIREAYSLGADIGYLICDKAFSGADVLATSYTLMQAIKSTGSFDLIICGRQTTDGDTAQVSGALAKWLNVPHIGMVSQIHEINNKTISLRQRLDNEELFLRTVFPCVISVERDIYVPRMKSLKLKMSAKKRDIKILKLHNMEDQNPDCYGLKGSATKVVKIYPVEKTQKQQIILEEAEAAARHICEAVLDMNL